MHYFNYIHGSGIAFKNHVCSNNGESLKRRFQKYKILIKPPKIYLQGFRNEKIT